MSHSPIKPWAAAYTAGAVAFGVGDAAWIGLAARDLYESAVS